MTSAISRFLLTVFMLFSTALSAQGQTDIPTQEGPLPENKSSLVVTLDDPPAELNIWNRPILIYRATLGGNTPQERVNSTIKRLKKIDKFAVYEELNQEYIEMGGLKGVAYLLDTNLILAFSEADLDPEGSETLEEAALRIQNSLEEIRIAFKEQQSPTLIGKGIGISLIATLVFALILKFLTLLQHRVRRAFIRKTASLKWMRLGKFDFRNYLIIILRQIFRLVILGCALSAAYFWIGVILAQFPFTRPTAQILATHLTTSLGILVSEIISALPKILLLFIIFYVTRGVAGLVANFAKTLETESLDLNESWLSRDTARATRRIVILLVWITGFMVAYPYIPGSGSQAFKGVSILLGLMLSMGSSGLVSQFMSGFVVLYSGAIRTGEYVNFGDIEGVITDIHLMSTRVKTPKNEYVIVPNSVLISKNTINYSRMQKDYLTQISTTVSIGYDTPWRQVEAMLLMAADQTAGVRKDPAPFVLQTNLGDWYISYELRVVPGNMIEKKQVLSTLHQQIQDVFNQFKVQIMSPNFIAQPENPLLVDPQNQAPEPSGRVFQRKGNKTTKRKELIQQAMAKQSQPAVKPPETPPEPTG